MSLCDQKAAPVTSKLSFSGPEAGVFWAPLACWSVLSWVLGSSYSVFMWITKCSLLLGNHLESIPLWSRASWSSMPRCTSLPGCGSGWWHKCHKDVSRRASQAVLVLQTPWTLESCNCSVLAKTGKLISCHGDFQLIHSINTYWSPPKFQACERCWGIEETSWQTWSQCSWVS